jgi:hypothetical protein
MPSQLKSDTARANGAKSRGPLSPGARAISAQNSLRHGFTACNTTLLKCENPDEFAATVDHYFDAHQPTTLAEEDLVNEMISARWRIRRLRVVETRLVDLEMIKNTPAVEKKHVEPDAITHLAEGFRNLIEDARSLSLLSRYESRLSRMYDRAYRTLREIRAEGPPPAPTEPPPEPKNAQTNPPGATADPRPVSPQAHESTEIPPPYDLPAARARAVLSFGIPKRLRRR